MATQELSDYVNGLSSATLVGTEELYLDTDEKTTVQDIANFNGAFKTKTVNIGDWNMDITASVTVAHGIGTFTKIRSVSAVIINDASSSIQNLESSDITGVGNGIITIDSTNITLFRVTGQTFDGTDYDSTPFNRGYVTIHYID